MSRTRKRPQSGHTGRMADPSPSFPSRRPRETAKAGERHGGPPRGPERHGAVPRVTRAKRSIVCDSGNAVEHIPSSRNTRASMRATTPSSTARSDKTSCVGVQRRAVPVAEAKASAFAVVKPVCRQRASAVLTPGRHRDPRGEANLWNRAKEVPAAMVAARRRRCLSGRPGSTGPLREQGRTSRE